MSGIVSRLYDSIKRGKEGKNKGISTGFDRLDKYTFGLQRKYLTVIGADQGVGKSTYALYTHVYKPLIEYLEKGTNINILYFSFELSDEVLFAKLLSLHIWEKYGNELSYEDILSLTGEISDKDLELIIKEESWLRQAESRITIVDKQVSAIAVYAILKEWHKKFGKFEDLNDYSEIYIPNDPEQYLIIILDHIKLLLAQNTAKEEIDLCCNYLISFRNKCNDTVCIVQQLNRGFKSMERRNSNHTLPELQDFSDSSGPTQAAELVITIFDPYREKMKSCQGYSVDQLNNLKIIGILKNRFGLSNKYVGCAFYGAVGYWKELPKPELIYDYSVYKELSSSPIKNEKIDKTNEIDMNVNTDKNTTFTFNF